MTIFIERELNDAEGGRVFIRLHRPEFVPSPNGGDHRCRLAIESGEGRIYFDKPIFGIDSLQAMELAFGYVRSLQPSIEAAHGRPLFFLEPDMGWSMPVITSSYDGRSTKG